MLLVEDNSTNQMVAGQLLEKLGVSVSIANHGAEAVAMLEGEDFDLVLMDMQMPVMDGVTATRRLRELGCRVPIIGLTANVSQADRETCLGAGMNEFASKPISRAKIEQVLARWLSGTVAAPEAPAIDTAPEPFIDEGYQADLIADLGDETFNDLLAAFWPQAAAYVAAAGQAYAANDRAGADHELHALKGAAATLGLSALAECAQNARTNDDPEPGIRALHGVLAATQVALDQRRPAAA